MIDLTGRAVLLERSEIDLRTVNLSSCASAPSPSSRVPPVRVGQRVLACWVQSRVFVAGNGFWAFTPLNSLLGSLYVTTGDEYTQEYLLVPSHHTLTYYKYKHARGFERS